MRYGEIEPIKNGIDKTLERIPSFKKINKNPQYISRIYVTELTYFQNFYVILEIKILYNPKPFSVSFFFISTYLSFSGVLFNLPFTSSLIGISSPFFIDFLSVFIPFFPYFLPYSPSPTFFFYSLCFVLGFLNIPMMKGRYYEKLCFYDNPKSRILSKALEKMLIYF